MSFMSRLIEMLRPGKAPRASAKTDLFDARLQRMNSRNRTACRATPFRNSRLHPAA